MKTALSEMKNTQNMISGTIGIAEENVRGLENRAIEIIQN